MINSLWINLPVADVASAKEFYLELGFKLNENHPESEEAVSLFVGKSNLVLMLFEESIFESFVNHDVGDTAEGSQVLFSIDVDTKEEVDELAALAVKAGGDLFGKPAAVQDVMYGCGFSDLDGHRWNVLYMNK